MDSGLLPDTDDRPKLHPSAARLFDWDARYRVSGNTLVQFERESSRPLVSSSAVLDHYGWRARLTPDRLEELDYSDRGFWNFYRPAVYRMTGRQFRVLMEFLEPVSPRAVWQRIGAGDGRDEGCFEELLAMLVYQRVLIRDGHGNPTLVARREGTHGVLIIGVGEKYLRMACSLAESIKAGSPDLPVALIHAAGEANLARKLERRRDLFDCLVQQDPRAYTIDGRFSANALKLTMDQLTPFDETLAIDADSVLFPSANLWREFDRLENAEFAPVCSGVFDTSMDPDILCTPSTTLRTVREHTPLAGPVYRIHSYFMFFRRTESMARYFARARELRTAASESPAYPRQRGHLGDEPFFSAASSLIPARIYSGYYMPIADKAFLGGDVNPISLREQFLGLTMIGDPPAGYVRVYDAVVAEAARMRGNSEPYFWAGKR